MKHGIKEGITQRVNLEYGDLLSSKMRKSEQALNIYFPP